MSEYLGMRWFKCDLHVHTPADPQHWQGSPIVPGQESQNATAFAEACHRTGLDVIAVTDHNFLSKDFLPYLKDALAEIEHKHGHKITLFPGFEFEADVGKGMHVLCLFEPDTNLLTIDHILTECGVYHPRIQNGRLQKSVKRLPEILGIIQKGNEQSGWRGIVIVPHVFENSLFDNDRISEWLQQEEFINPDLLAVEVPKPVERMGTNFKKLFRSGSDCDPGWRRSRPIATLMGSDNKKLIERDASGRPEANTLGYRHTWIKMSHPGIESLRQAFLDPNSRIRPSGDDPSSQEKHARILSLSVSNAAFLGDQQIVFSPNFNAIIGGRGSGKSALLEGMRLAMGKDDDPKLDDRAREKVRRIKELLTKMAGSEVRVHWRDADGVEDHLLYVVAQEGNGSCRVEGRSMTDLSSFLRELPVQFFSQQQLNQITERGGNVLLTLLDEFSREELKPLLQEEAELRREIEQLFIFSTALEQTEKDLSRLEQESADLERQWEVRSALQEDARKHQGLKAQQAYIQKLKSALDEDAARLMDVANDIWETHVDLGSSIERWPHGVWFQEKDNRVLQAKETLKVAIGRAVETYRKTVFEMFGGLEWFDIQQQCNQADETFAQACAAKGIDPADVSRIQEIGQKRTLKKQELDQKRKERLRLQQLLAKMPELFQQLHDNWLACHDVRKRVADEIVQSAKSDNKSVIGLMVSYFSDAVLFKAVWNRLSTDGRTRLGRNWEEIGGIVRDEYLESGHTNHLSLWNMLQSWMESEDSMPAHVQEKLRRIQVTVVDIKSYLSGTARKTWQETQLIRIDDTVDLVLYQSNGHDEVGRVSDGTLSDGQRNTAALAMLLARGNHPLVIDQPEDELDSNFIFQELVPMLRRLKHSRQIILVTHNANLPVNGDAELVYALKAQGGRGVKRAAGGLDRTDVTQAILDIMEGSEQAFRQRREKYHF
ncbi:MAG: AAA family ATPase [Magnetococcales bacterium]|nr:AAA family ATPase [Magnetococcales bacterium]NGZ07004.1 AAA family ATPase [Magnetococcales bacterium]